MAKMIRRRWMLDDSGRLLSSCYRGTFWVILWALRMSLGYCARGVKRDSVLEKTEKDVVDSASIGQIEPEEQSRSSRSSVFHL